MMYEINVGYIRSKYGAIYNVYCDNLGDFSIDRFYVKMGDRIEALKCINRNDFDIFLRCL